ncbi:CDP-diacylglycerol--serine O-phosphatidyltransferase, partial [Ochrobactrum sp. MR34]|nr:CDP-diacylglycerol--serine O-phosphatidyltransferase [Ochrobactrum sp. MR34]
YAGFLMSFTWQTLTLTALGYLLFLPFSALAWKRRFAAEALHTKAD